MPVIKKLLMGMVWFCVLVFPSIVVLGMLTGFVMGILHYGRPAAAVTQATGATVGMAGALLALLLSVAGTALGKLPGAKSRPRRAAPPAMLPTTSPATPPPAVDPSRPYLLIFHGYKAGESPAAVQVRLAKIDPTAVNLLAALSERSPVVLRRFADAESAARDVALMNGMGLLCKVQLQAVAASPRAVGAGQGPLKIPQPGGARQVITAGVAVSLVGLTLCAGGLILPYVGALFLVLAMMFFAITAGGGDDDFYHSLERWAASAPHVPIVGVVALVVGVAMVVGPFIYLRLEAGRRP